MVRHDRLLDISRGWSSLLNMSNLDEIKMMMMPYEILLYNHHTSLIFHPEHTAKLYLPILPAVGWGHVTGCWSMGWRIS